MSYGLRTNWSLSQWQHRLSEMFGNINKQRNPLETFARVTEIATGISRGVREEDKEILKKFVPRFLAWLLGLSTQLGIDLEEAVYNSYPGVCTYCRLPEGCTCKLKRTTDERISDPNEIEELQSRHPRPTNLLEWVGMFAHIYHDINKNTGRLQMLGHFMEELGEVCEIIRFHLTLDEDLERWNVTLSRTDIEKLLPQEFADLFAWLCGLANSMGIEIDAFMKDIYQPNCPECAKPVCECPPYHVHNALRLGAKR